MKKFLVVILLLLIFFVVFVYFGGGIYVKHMGYKVVETGKYLENLQGQMERFIQDKIDRLQRIEKSLISPSK